MCPIKSWVVLTIALSKTRAVSTNLGTYLTSLRVRTQLTLYSAVSGELNL